MSSGDEVQMWSSGLAALGAVMGVLWAVLYPELRECAPWLAKRVLDHAVAGVDPEDRERLAEEWAAELEEVPGKLLKLVFAVSLWWGIYRVSFISRLSRRTARHEAKESEPAKVEPRMIGGLPVIDPKDLDRYDEVIAELFRQQATITQVSVKYDLREHWLSLRENERRKAEESDQT